MVITFNCGAGLPQASLLKGLKQAPELLVVGLQEICDLNAQHIIMQNSEAAGTTWQTYLQQDLDKQFGKNYQLLIRRNLVGLCLLVFKRGKVETKDLVYSLVRTGAGGKLGNKGAIGFSLQLEDTVLTFINVHLCAGEKEQKQQGRASDIQQILANVFQERSNFSELLQFKLSDSVFFLGDLNMRTRLPYQDVVRQSVVIRKLQSQKKDEAVMMLRNMLAHDELRSCKEHQKFWARFHQHEILFLPTYKYKVGTEEYDEKKNRVPSWCDRILWQGQARCLQYQALDHVRSSDHRPVRGVYSLPIRSLG